SRSRGRGSWRRGRRRRPAPASRRGSTALPSTSSSRGPRAGAYRRSRPAAGARRSGSAFCSEPEDSLWSYGHRGVPGRLGRAAQDGFGEQRARGLRRDEGRLDVERVALEVRLEARERNAGLHEPLEHADVVGRPDVARRAQDDRARQPVAPPEELPVGGTVRLDAARRLRLRLVPRAERRDVEVADLDDVDDEAAAVADVLAGHVGAGHPPVLLGGWLDRVDRRLARDEVAPLGDVARRVDVRHARAQVVVDDHAAVDCHAGALEPPEVGLDARGHDHDVANDVAARGEAKPLAPLGVLGRGWPGVQYAWTPRPPAPGTGVRTAEEPVAIRQ